MSRRLADVLLTLRKEHGVPLPMDVALNAVLPVVERIAAERAAEELLAAADVNWADRVRWSEVRTDLRARAAALGEEASR